MAKKNLNDRCPLRAECERKCEYKFRELECDYYANNGIGEDRTIPDQEEKRGEAERKTYEEQYEADLADVEVDEAADHNAEVGNMVMLPIDQLHPHPDNPRKDIGDVSELAESIKVNGVLQNLTVVPNMVTGEITGDTWQRGYKVIIGHRRLAAAKLAGIETLPCVVVNMSDREQLSTMLTENMQRSDLTVYEQAQGFQMMLDMGDTVEDIAEKSGFSATTVRRRVKLLDLDKDKFKKSEERGVSLFDYMELDKLKSTERKNEMLEYIGTENFKYKLKQAIDAEATEEKKAAWVEHLSAFATQVDSRTGYSTVKSSYVSSKIDLHRPDDADTVEYFFCIEKWGYIALMTKATEKVLSPEEKQKELEEQQRQEKKAADQKVLSEATARAYELRSEFVASVTTTAVKKCMADIIALWAYAEYWDDTSWLNEEEVERATGAPTVELESEEDDDSDSRFTLQYVMDAVQKSPEKVLLRMIYERLGDSKSEGYFRSYWNSYIMKHEENEKLDRIYALLEKLGYEMSDDEKALQNGTHELFNPIADTEESACVLCKSAHPGCDGCCKNCNDHCNAWQTCRKESEGEA